VNPLDGAMMLYQRWDVCSVGVSYIIRALRGSSQLNTILVQVLVAEKGCTTGLHEKLTMTVAMPALWGVPPTVDILKKAIRSGGGIVEKTYKKWEFF
jgi:hypothetical protein